MRAEFKTVGFWMSLTTGVAGIATLAFGLTGEQHNALVSAVGAILAAASQFGFLTAESKVRAAKIAAYSTLRASSADATNIECVSDINSIKELIKSA